MSDALAPDIIDKQHLIGSLLAEFCNHYDHDVPLALADVWWSRFGQVATSILFAARDMYFEQGRGFPDPDVFEQYIEVAADHVQREIRPGGACPKSCDRGWIPSPAVMRGRYRYDNEYAPCPACRPTVAEQHVKKWAPQARRTAPIQPDETLSFNPLASIRGLKAELAGKARPRWAGQEGPA